MEKEKSNKLSKKVFKSQFEIMMDKMGKGKRVINKIDKAVNRSNEKDSQPSARKTAEENIELLSSEGSEAVELKDHEIKNLRDRWHREQNGICPILNKKVPAENMTLDHAHVITRDETSMLCRGAISRGANMLEGKIQNNFVRMGLSKHIDLPSFLRNLADYLENNKAHTSEKYIHPSEVHKKDVSKRNYNKLKKLYTEALKRGEVKGVFPPHPKSRKPSKKLTELFEQFNIELYNPEPKKLNGAAANSQKSLSGLGSDKS